MRRPLLAALILGPAAAAFFFVNAGDTSVSPVAVPGQAASARPCDRSCEVAALDATLRLNQLQQVGTNASAKLKPEAAVLSLIRMGGKEGAQALDFGHENIAAQLDSGLRALSFDIVNDPEGGAFKRPAIANMAMVLHSREHDAAMERPGFKVLHVPDVDYRSSCPALRDCLAEVMLWSDSHPGHLPIVITLRPTDKKTPMPGASQPPMMDKTALTALDAEIRAIVDESRLITPAMVRGSHASLREAVAADGWPLLGAARGKVLLVLHGAGAKDYRGQLMFAAGTDGDRVVQVFEDPVANKARIAAAVRAGLLAITHADLETREARKGDMARRDAAFASGAQVILTDFPRPDPAVGGYRVSLADMAQARCGAALKSEPCIAIRQSDTIRTAGLP